jgi:hypothetical protein
MQLGHQRGAFADRSAHPFDRAGAHVAYGENAGDAGLKGLQLSLGTVRTHLLDGYACTGLNEPWHRAKCSLATNSSPERRR